MRNTEIFYKSMSPISTKKKTILKLIIQKSSLGNLCEIALTSMPQNLTNGMSTLVQVMVWSCQATSHYLSKCSPTSTFPYGVTMPQWLTHWGRVTHICISKPRRQAIIWTNAGILWIGPLGTNFIEILIEIQTFSFKKVHLKMSSAKWRPFGLGLNVLKKMVPGSESILWMRPANGRRLTL